MLIHQSGTWQSNWQFNSIFHVAKLICELYTSLLGPGFVTTVIILFAKCFSRGNRDVLICGQYLITHRARSPRPATLRWRYLNFIHGNFPLNLLIFILSWLTNKLTALSQFISHKVHFCFTIYDVIYNIMNIYKFSLKQEKE